MFELRIFWGEASRYAAIPLIPASCLGYCEITRFLSRSTIATGIHLDGDEIIRNVAQTIGTVAVRDPHSGILGPTSGRNSACPNHPE